MDWVQLKSASSVIKSATARLYITLLLAFLAFFLIANSLTPAMGEDYMLIAFPPSEGCENIIDLFSKMIARINLQMGGWNARLGEQLSIVFSCFDRVVFCILNSFVDIYYLVLIQLYAFPSKRSLDERIWSIVVSFVVIMLFQPALGEIFFWRTGSTNYLWGICILLSFALPLRDYLCPESRDLIGGSRLKTVFFAVLGFFAGMTNENSVVAFLALYVGVIVFNMVKRKHLPLWIYTSFCTFLAGFIFLVSAPSTAKRVAYYNEAFGLQDLTAFDYIARTPNVIHSFFSENWIFACIVITLLLINLLIRRSEIVSDPRSFFDPLWWLVLSLVACGALIMSPYVEIRSFLLTDFMLVVCIVYYSYALIGSLKVRRIAFNAFILLLLVSVVPCVQGILSTYQEYFHFSTQRDMAIRASAEDVVIWTPYEGDVYSRVLTTREDYCMANEKALSYYYQKDIHVEADNSKN